jgi:hypothetical protein
VRLVSPVLAAAGICLLADASSLAIAKTGAELLQLEQTFGTGYIQGALDYMLADYTSYDQTRNRLTDHRLNCLTEKKLTTKDLYDAVIAEIQAEPALLEVEAVDALRNVTFKLCGPPPKP